MGGTMRAAVRFPVCREVSCARAAHASKLAWNRSVSAEKLSSPKEFPSAAKGRPAQPDKPREGALETQRTQLTGAGHPAGSSSAAQVRAECSTLVREIVDAAAGFSVKARLRGAARLIGLPIGRVTDFYYREVRRVEAHEADRIRDCALEAQQRQLARLEADYARLRERLVAEAPRGLGWLCPPALGPVQAVEGEEE